MEEFLQCFGGDIGNYLVSVLEAIHSLATEFLGLTATLSSMSERLQVDAPAPLLAYLLATLEGWKRNTLKDRLRLGCITVNDEPVHRHDHPLQAGDRVEISSRAAGTGPRRPPSKLTPIYLDDDLVAINKPAGLLSVTTDDDDKRNAMSLVRDSLSRPGHPAQLWPVHRIDRETSGVLLIARSRGVCKSIQSQWNEAEKIYLAMVEGQPMPATGVIDKPLWEDRNLRVHVGVGEGSRDARTKYQTLSSDRGNSLLEVRLDSGRRHQIRAHMAAIGHPVVGDDRYGTAGSRMALHALRLTIPGPQGGDSLVFEAPMPKGFAALR